MSAVIIDGKAVAAEIQQEVAAEAATLRAKGVIPCIAVALVGDDPASHTYVRNKVRTAEQLGLRSVHRIFPADTSQAELLDLVREWNEDPSVSGILVQLPLPPQIESRAVLEAIDPRKDVDGFHPFNVGTLVTGGVSLPPCTPAGILELIRRAGVSLAGKEAVVVGRSNIVGKPVAMMLLAEHATVTICHSRTQDLASVCRRGDVLVAAVGRARLITADHVKEGAVVIDVGTNRVDGKLVGDVDFASVSQKAAALTPVPGGVGPMTIAMLLKNTVTAARLQAS
ncbi:MAG: methylenetetrahydrofolate dehydrogenase/methenyltetrahydrofolate cyclohydrolase [Armatimonadetes bacterium]|jgi:methylenetetrahydrofolate dehydrogenase (NADP+)/methenyltetrahydrofolate cyclohydrolase|nr:methylenetetrahydrofolate dehydrogenase/methenyltetrahydrofolate cyclohydrolase [Armatimonadota bacterium]